MDWLRNGGKFTEQSAFNMNVVSEASLDGGAGRSARKLTAVNRIFDYLYRGQGPRNPHTSHLCLYSFFCFYRKVKMSEKDDPEPPGPPDARPRRGRPRYPREPLDPHHEQSNSKILIRNNPEKVPSLSGRIPQRPKGWDAAEDEAAGAADIPEADDATAMALLHEQRENYALFVMAVFRDLHHSRPLALPEGRTWWDVCLEWWRTLEFGDEGEAV